MNDFIKYSWDNRETVTDLEGAVKTLGIRLGSASGLCRMSSGKLDEETLFAAQWGIPFDSATAKFMAKRIAYGADFVHPDYVEYEDDYETDYDPEEGEWKSGRGDFPWMPSSAFC